MLLRCRPVTQLPVLSPLVTPAPPEPTPPGTCRPVTKTLKPTTAPRTVKQDYYGRHGPRPAQKGRPDPGVRSRRERRSDSTQRSDSTTDGETQKTLKWSIRDVFEDLERRRY